MARERKIYNGKAVVIYRVNTYLANGDSFVTKTVTFNKRYYTVYGNRFAVRGRNVPYTEGFNKRLQYSFLDWEKLEGLMLE